MTGIHFERLNPPDPSDPRVIPASMQFTVVRHNGRPYIEWKIGEPIPLNGTHENREYPYVIAAVISPADARVFAQSLLATADDADGGELRLAGMMQPPIPPPPPPPKSAK